MSLKVSLNGVDFLKVWIVQIFYAHDKIDM